jgi:hypothetical protein
LPRASSIAEHGNAIRSLTEGRGLWGKVAGPSRHGSLEDVREPNVFAMTSEPAGKLRRAGKSTGAAPGPALTLLS